ncbi:MAG TPA: DUF4382 domain-containing protein [Ramlibacter sp.]
MEKTIGSAARWVARVGSIAAVMALAACGGGGGGSAAPATGTLKLSMTDAPACYSSVVLNVEKIRVHTSNDSGTGDGDGGWKDIVPANAPVKIDLLDLTNGQLAELGSTTVPAGSYHQLRLVLANNGNTVTPVGGTPQPLKTPSGQQSGVKIKADFEVAANQVSDYLMDFDACKSIVLTGSGTYILKPVVRLSQKPAGSIQGYVTTTMTLTGTTVSAQQNGTVLRSTTPDAAGKFTLAYLNPGTYTVVITSSERATGVVESVPVGTSTVSINGTSTAVVLPTSLMNTVTGTVTAGTTLNDVLVTALQQLTTQLIEVTSVRVDDATGAYSMSLPVDAPVRTTYASGGLPAFTADGSATGEYTIRATAEGHSPQSTPVTITSGSGATANFGF